jgi:hypothetical protein
MSYESNAIIFMNRVMALIPENPHILTMESPSELLKIDGLEYEDLGLSFYQASWALGQAKIRSRK